MGNEQTSVSFFAAWTKRNDTIDSNIHKQLWNLEVKDVDLVWHSLGDFMRDKKVCIIANVTSQ